MAKKRRTATGSAGAKVHGEMRGILLKVSPEGLRELKLLAIDRDHTLSAICIEALNEFLKKHGRKPVVRNPMLD